MIQLFYVHDGRPVAEGERVVVYQAGRLFVRTGTKPLDPTTGQISYTLREVKVVVNTAPVGGNLTMEVEVASP